MDEVKKFLSALQGLGFFNPDYYSQRLLKASKSTQCLNYFEYQGPDVDQAGTTFDDRDCSELVTFLAASSIARCMSNMSDDYGFHDSVNTEKAVVLSKKTIASLLTSMYGDHVNNFLRQKGLRTLHELHNDPQFFENYHTLLLSSPSDHNALSRNVGPNYTMALLYCYEYLKHGPGFDITEVLSAESEDTTHWEGIFKNWIEQSQGEDFKKTNPNFRIDLLVPSVGAVLALNGYPDVPSRDVAEHLRDQVVGNAVAWNISDDVAQFSILGQEIWASWDSATSDYQSAVVQAVNESKTETLPNDWQEVITTFGDRVDQYMTEFWGLSLFTKRAGNRTRSEGPFGS